MEKGNKLGEKVTLETNVREILRKDCSPTRVASLLERISKYGVAKTMHELVSLPHPKILMFRYSGRKTLRQLNDFLKKYNLPCINIDENVYYRNSGALRYREYRKVKLEQRELFKNLNVEWVKVRKFRGYLNGDFRTH